jgi:hypothetical protein
MKAGGMLAAFERAVQGDRLDEALALLHQVLANFDRVAPSGGEHAAERASLRLAAATAELVSNPRLELSQSAYETLCMSQPALAGVYLCTPWAAPNHVIARLADVRDPARLRFRDPATLRKCLLCWTPESRFELDLAPLAERFPEIVAPALLGRLGCDLLARPRVAAAMDRTLAADWSALRTHTPSLPLILGLSHAWMNVSYATHADRHRIKSVLNDMARRWIEGQGVAPDEAPEWRARERPRLLVPIELFHSTHAMFRCFGRSVAALAERFEVIGVAPDHCIDEAARAIFPRCITFAAERIVEDFAGLVAELRALAPDVVYYPSLGMTNYAILLANLRLAPVQCFGLGHPATSRCASIDYALVQAQDFTTPDVYSETVVLTADETSPTIDRVLEHVAPGPPRGAPATIEIAVNAKHMKLHARFLAACRRIAEQAARPVRFHFFPGVSGYRHAFVRHEIRRQLPQSTVHPTTDYATYIERLAACDVRLGTFPFGGANTNMDCFGLCIPFVVMDGPEPHARSDAAQLRRAGLPDWLVADSEADYVAAACRLIDDDDARLAVAAAMRARHADGFFRAAATETAPELPATLAWAQRNHPALQRDGRRVWRRADLAEDLGPCGSR